MVLRSSVRIVLKRRMGTERKSVEEVIETITPSSVRFLMSATMLCHAYATMKCSGKVDSVNLNIMDTYNDRCISALLALQCIA
jgi:hypothetical protein